MNSNWSEPGNRSPAVVPQNGDDLVCTGDVANKQMVQDLGDDFVVNNLRIDPGTAASHYTPTATREGALIPSSPWQFRISYVGGDGTTSL